MLSDVICPFAHCVIKLSVMILASFLLMAAVRAMFPSTTIMELDDPKAEALLEILHDIESQRGCYEHIFDNITSTMDSGLFSVAFDFMALNYTYRDKCANGGGCTELTKSITISNTMNNIAGWRPENGIIDFVMDTNYFQVMMVNISDSNCFLRVTVKEKTENEEWSYNITTHMFGSIDFTTKSGQEKLAELVPNVYTAKQDAQEEGVNVIAFLGAARIDDTTRLSTLREASFEISDRIDFEFKSMSGGFNDGMPLISWEIGLANDGCLSCLPEAGVDNMIPNTTDTVISVYGDSWGDETPALTYLSDMAVATAPFGTWTFIELANLVHLNRTVAILLVDYKSSYEWWTETYLDKVGSDEKCNPNDTDIECTVNVLGTPLPVFSDPDKVVQLLQSTAYSTEEDESDKVSAAVFATIVVCIVLFVVMIIVMVICLWKRRNAPERVSTVAPTAVDEAGRSENDTQL